MPPTELTAFAARLGLELELAEDEEVTPEIVKKAITRELGGLQSAENSKLETQRQVVLTSALSELEAGAAAPSPTSTDLVPIPAATFTQMLELFQKNAAPAPAVATLRPDPVAAMRTNVKATATQASKDFTKSRSWPFGSVGVLIVGAYGLRDKFNVDELVFPEQLFLPFMAAAVAVTAAGYAVSVLSQRKANSVLRRLYNSDVQSRALDYLDNEGRHPLTDLDGRTTNTFSLAEYRQSLMDAAGGRFGYGGPLTINLSTIDIEAALDDATGLALDRLCELNIIEAVVSGRRQVFRILT